MLTFVVLTAIFVAFFLGLFVGAVLGNVNQEPLPYEQAQRVARKMEKQ